MMGLSVLRPVIRWKSWGVTVNSFLAIWKAWVVSHHLLASAYSKMLLADLFGIKCMMGSKLAACTKAFVSFIKAWYYAKMQLELPLPLKGGKAYGRQEKESKNHAG